MLTSTMVAFDEEEAEAEAEAKAEVAEAAGWAGAAAGAASSWSCAPGAPAKLMPMMTDSTVIN